MTKPLDLENLASAVRLGSNRFRANVEQFTREAAQDPLRALRRLGHDATVASATLAAMDEAVDTLRSHASDPRHAIILIAQYAASLASNHSLRSDVVEQLSEDSRRRAYARIADTLIPYLED